MKIIITEEQSKNLAKALNEETYQMPQGIDKHENKPYTINPDNPADYWYKMTLYETEKRK